MIAINQRFVRRVLLLVVALACGCSLVFDTDTDQCSTDSDCARFGGDFRCEKGLCEGPAGAGGASGARAGAGNGGTAGAAGAGADAGGADGGAAGADGGAAGADGGAAGADGGAAGAGAGAGGTSGGGPSGECTSHKQCFDIHGDDEPMACVAGRCVALKTEQCPLVLPLKDRSFNALKSSDAVILGAFSHIPEPDFLSFPTLNFDLAVTEFMEETNGLPAAGGKRRQVVMVVCHFMYPTQDGLLPAARHMIEDLRVPAILAGLVNDDLQYVFEEVGLDHGVFFMSPLPPDENLLNLPDDGLIWHMLSGPRSLSVSYQPLLDMATTHLRNRGDLDPGEELRVGLITATDERFSNDTGTILRGTLEFNGRSAEENEPDNFTAVATTSFYTNPGFVQTPVADAILALKPHIVIAATDIEMEKAIIPLIEGRWALEAPGEPRPFYLLSPFQYSTSLLDQVQRQFSFSYEPPLYRRLAGINFPAAVDSTVFDEYVAQFRMANPDYNGRIIGENFYDSVYYLIYAAAAAPQPLTGSRIAQGMLRLLSGTQSYAVGRADMNAALTTLQSSASSTFRLIGSIGPPSFDNQGGRNEAGSVWCVSALVEFLADGLRYDATSQKLVGTFPCWAFPALPPG